MSVADGQAPPGPSTPVMGHGIDRGCVALSALSALLVATGWALGWRGGDFPAQLYRVDLLRHDGFLFWDSQWYGGHWTLDYSVIYPSLGALFGLEVVAVASAVMATAAFDRLVVGHLGPAARVGSAVFAVSVIVETSIGQLAFFGGEAFGLASLWCVTGPRRRWVAGGLLAVASTLTSPLAGAFTALAFAAWGVSTLLERRRPGCRDGEGRRMFPLGGRVQRCGLVALAALAPIAVVTLLFPGQGAMPYPVLDWLWEAGVATVIWCLLPREQRLLRTATVLYGATTVFAVAVPTALGGNIGRLEDAIALPLVVAVWPSRRASGAVASKVLLGAVTVPLILSAWTPAWAAMTSGATRPWTSPAYYAPLSSWLREADWRGGAPVGRVEVVPTKDHWEAAYVAPIVPLARGWERQLDIADNPLFYGRGALNPTTYRAWLELNGVRYVALADAPRDLAGVAEARLVARGLTGLRPVWSSEHWQVLQVPGAGIVSGHARLEAMTGEQVALTIAVPGVCEVRVRWRAHWRVTAGAARITPAPDGWITLTTSRTGRITLSAGPAGW